MIKFYKKTRKLKQGATVYITAIGTSTADGIHDDSTDNVIQALKKKYPDASLTSAGGGKVTAVLPTVLQLLKKA